MSDLPPTLEALDAALAAVGDDTMTLSQLDGLVAAVLVCPEAVPPSRWLPLVWAPDGDDDEVASFESAEAAQAVVGQILAHYNAIAEVLLNAPQDYAPILDHHAPTDETFWEFWIAGFEAGMALYPEAWTPLIEAGENEAADALALLLTLHGISVRDPELEQTQAQIDDLTAVAPDVIPECVTVLAQARNAAPKAPIRRTKTGRNDPCPCGSGLKFKKCCGGPSASRPH